MSRYDIIVIGAGVNGLAAAATLARGGRSVLVVERRGTIGGTAATEEFHTGFRANMCRDDIGWVPADLVRDLELVRHGASLITAPVGLVAGVPDAPPVAVWPDVARTAEALRAASPSDASRWGAFARLIAQVAGFLQGVYGERPPRIQSRSGADLLSLAATGRRLRSLGRREMMEVLRAIPMPVDDLLGEWFESPALRAGLATLGVRDVAQGPLSGGTALVLFHQHVGLAVGAIGVRRSVRGGSGALATALAAAARGHGADIRLSAEVTRIVVRDDRAAGVVLANGEEAGAGRVVSGADPRRTFGLVDPGWLDPALLGAVDHVRLRGATARVHFALERLPELSTGGRAWPADWLGGTLVVAPGVMGIERAHDQAKYGELPVDPALTLCVPTIGDPSLAPAGRHVLSVSVHHVPYALRGGWTDTARDALGDLVEDQLAARSPGFRERVIRRRVLSPADLESRFGVSEGSLTHGELALDQFLFMRPVPTCARYVTPLPGLWLCGIGSHPGTAGGAPGMLAARELAKDRRAEG
jgi:phytoene dehydrogenase-like protein